MALRPGLTGSAQLVVTDGDTAMALGTGDVPVVATPRLAGLAEVAAIDAVRAELTGTTTTVGYRIQLDHVAPTAVGGTVRAEAILETVASARLIFRVSISDDRGLVAAGRITRVLVERDRFLDRAGRA